MTFQSRLLAALKHGQSQQLVSASVYLQRLQASIIDAAANGGHELRMCAPTEPEVCRIVERWLREQCLTFKYRDSGSVLHVCF